MAARLGDPQHALELAREAHELLAGHLRHEPNAAHALAVAHAALGEIDVAAAEFERAVTALADREQWREAIYVARDWAETLRTAGRGEHAYAVLEQATSFGQRMGAPPSLARTDAKPRHSRT